MLYNLLGAYKTCVQVESASHVSSGIPTDSTSSCLWGSNQRGEYLGNMDTLAFPYVF